MNQIRWKGKPRARPDWMLPHTALAPAPATRPWQSRRKHQPASDTTSCSSCPINPKISRQIGAKAFVPQLDARIGPKAAATSGTVPTVGDCRCKAKLQKEHALGHSMQRFWGLRLVWTRAPRPRLLTLTWGFAGGSPAPTQACCRRLWTDRARFQRPHEAKISKSDPLHLAQ